MLPNNWQHLHGSINMKTPSTLWITDDIEDVIKSGNSEVWKTAASNSFELSNVTPEMISSGITQQRYLVYLHEGWFFQFVLNWLDDRGFRVIEK